MRTRKIYYLETSENTYLRRHDLYNAGVRWDARGKHWWAERPGPVKKAAEMLGGKSEAVGVHVQKLPQLAKTHRGGRPRKPRRLTGTGKPVHMQTQQPANGSEPPEGMQPAPQPVPVVAGQPFMRKTQTQDRRQQDRRATERRNEADRPTAVLLVPVAIDGQAAQVQPVPVEAGMSASMAAMANGN